MHPSVGYAAALDVVTDLIVDSVERGGGEPYGESYMQDRASELPRTPLPRTLVNKRNGEGLLVVPELFDGSVPGFWLGIGAKP